MPVVFFNILHPQRCKTSLISGVSIGPSYNVNERNREKWRPGRHRQPATATMQCHCACSVISQACTYSLSLLSVNRRPRGAARCAWPQSPLDAAVSTRTHARQSTAAITPQSDSGDPPHACRQGATAAARTRAPDRTHICLLQRGDPCALRHLRRARAPPQPAWEARRTLTKVRRWWRWRCVCEKFY